MSTFILSGNTSDFTTCHHSVNLDPNTKYEAALLSLDTYNSIPNITAGKNNTLSYSTDNGKTWKAIALGTGAYELKAINNEVKRQLIANGDSDSAISITANVSRLTSIVSIEHPTYKIDFGVKNSIGPVLGFGAVAIGNGYNESPNIVDIMKVNSILVNLNIVAGSHVNGAPSSVIYSFYPNVAPGYKIVERPNPSLIYYPVSNLPGINRMKVWLTDQNGDLVDFRGETITIRIYIREVKPRIIESNILKEIIEFKNYIKNK